MKTLIAALLSFILTAAPVGAPVISHAPTTTVLGEREFSLAQRYNVASVNEIMKKNILLNLAYMEGTVTKKSDISWDKIESPSDYSFTLKPGEVFAFHDSILPEYQDKVVKTTNAHFNSTEGFVSDGYLVGDGVCHFASIIDYAASDAGLDVLRTKAHTIAHINQIPDEYGVSIYVEPGSGYGARNNLYITNNKGTDVTFHFTYDANQELKVSITQTMASV